MYTYVRPSILSPILWYFDWIPSNALDEHPYSICCKFVTVLCNGDHGIEMAKQFGSNFSGAGKSESEKQLDESGQHGGTHFDQVQVLCSEIIITDRHNCWRSPRIFHNIKRKVNASNYFMLQRLHLIDIQYAINHSCNIFCLYTFVHCQRQMLLASLLIIMFSSVILHCCLTLVSCTNGIPDR